MNSEQLEVFAEIEDRHWWFTARREIVHRVVERLVVPNNSSTIVDIGCGTGGNIGSFAENYQCIGIDTSPTAISLSEKRYPKVRFHCSPDENCFQKCIAEASVVLMMDVMEHVADDFAFFSHSFSMSRPGTLFLITVPADMSLWSRHDESNLHFRRYERSRFEEVWNGLPSCTRLCSYFNRRLYPIIKLIRTFNRVLGRSSGAAGMDFKLPAGPINGWLERVFASEARGLIAQMESRPSDSPAKGVSLIAVIERKSGEMAIRRKPTTLQPDPHVPHAA